MRVYRVEHPSYVHPGSQHPAGPYTISNIFDAETMSDYEYDMTEYSDAMCMDHMDMNSHPVPGGILSARRQRWVVGMESMEALHDWFGDWLDTLYELGFIVAVYEASTYEEGEAGQILFDTETANLLDSPALV